MGAARLLLAHYAKSPKLSKKFKTLNDLRLKKEKRKEDDSAAPTLYRGVTNSRTRSGGRWVAQYSGGRGKQVQLGTFAGQRAAAQAVADYINKSKKRKAAWGLSHVDKVTPSDLRARKRGKVSDFISRFKFLHKLSTCLEDDPCYPGDMAKTLEQYGVAENLKMFEQEPGIEDAAIQVKIIPLKDRILEEFKRVRGKQKYKEINCSSYKKLRSDAQYDLRTDRLIEVIKNTMNGALDLDCSEDIAAYQRTVARCMGAVRWCDQLGLLESASSGGLDFSGIGGASKRRWTRGSKLEAAKASTPALG